jgi:hypothetical protein
MAEVLKNHIKSSATQKFSRSKDIPPIAPDCGWNHIEEKKDRPKMSGLNFFKRR